MVSACATTTPITAAVTPCSAPTTMPGESQRHREREPEAAEVVAPAQDQRRRRDRLDRLQRRQQRRDQDRHLEPSAPVKIESRTAPARRRSGRRRSATPRARSRSEPHEPLEPAPIPLRRVAEAVLHRARRRSSARAGPGNIPAIPSTIEKRPAPAGPSTQSRPIEPRTPSTVAPYIPCRDRPVNEHGAPPHPPPLPLAQRTCCGEPERHHISASKGILR